MRPSFPGASQSVLHPFFFTPITQVKIQKLSQDWNIHFIIEWLPYFMVHIIHRFLLSQWYTASFHSDLAHKFFLLLFKLRLTSPYGPHHPFLFSFPFQHYVTDFSGRTIWQRTTQTVPILEHPRKLTELRIFLCLCNVFRRFVSKVARVFNSVSKNLRKG